MLRVPMRSWPVMSLLSPNEGFVLMVVVLGPLVLWFGHRQRAGWTRTLETLGPSLGLRPDPEHKWSFTGEHQGWRMALGMHRHRMGGGKRRFFLTLRMPLEFELPRGFVAAPRKWESFIAPFFDGMIKAGDARLDDRFFFQCDDPAQGRKFVDDLEVREALAHLGGGTAIGYIHENEVGIAFTGRAPDEAAVHPHAHALIATAMALHAARRRSGP
jgi:hypothetical protein